MTTVDEIRATVPGRTPDDGLATVWAAWWTLVCLTIGMAGAFGAAIMARQHHLDGAADLVALSAAARLQRSGDGCVAAAEIARANEVELDGCEIEEQDLVVRVTDNLRLPFGIDGRIESEARAGP